MYGFEWFMSGVVVVLAIMTASLFFMRRPMVRVLLGAFLTYVGFNVMAGRIYPLLIFGLIALSSGVISIIMGLREMKKRP